MKFAVLGASGIGQYHFRELKKLNCDVVAILGKSDLSSRKTADFLYDTYGFKVNFYSDLDKLLKLENVDAVVISTPCNTHYDIAKTCLLKGVHVLCEKPLVQCNLIDSTAKLLETAKEKNKILSVNTQWAYFVECIDVPEKINSFEVYSEPGSTSEDLLFDHLSHANSMLTKLIPDGDSSDFSFEKVFEKEIVFRFLYSNYAQSCNVKYHFKFKDTRPRDIVFSINGKKYRRIVGDNYEQFLSLGDSVKKIEDPLFISVKRFVDSLNRNGVALISEREILENSLLQEKIVSEYHNFINKSNFAD